LFLAAGYLPQPVYVGFSPDVNERLRAHNGLKSGGAAATRNGRPWERVLYVSGFPSKHAALCFEYAWHYPQKVGVGPFNHIRLIRWMKESYTALRRDGKAGSRRGYRGLESKSPQFNAGLSQWKGMHLAVNFSGGMDKEKEGSLRVPTTKRLHLGKHVLHRL